tara:strand:+ start:590 stop:790 length:201 start_codon:yes stop_codon:yes gene_type:complete
MGIMWCMRPSSKELEEMNRGRSDDGKNTEVEDTSSLDDAWDVLIRLAGSGVVHDPTRPNKPTSGSS